MLVEKQTYKKPELIRRGNIETVTQAFGGLGSGDLFNTHFFNGRGQDGCHEKLQWLCTGS
jgi:hypothetical protein